MPRYSMTACFGGSQYTPSVRDPERGDGWHAQLFEGATPREAASLFLASDRHLQGMQPLDSVLVIEHGSRPRRFWNIPLNAEGELE